MGRSRRGGVGARRRCGRRASDYEAARARRTEASCDAAARERAVHVGRVGADGRPRRPDPAGTDARDRAVGSATPASSSGRRATSATNPAAVVAALAPVRARARRRVRADPDRGRATASRRTSTFLDAHDRDRSPPPGARAGRARGRRERDATRGRGTARRDARPHRSAATTSLRAAERVRARGAAGARRAASRPPSTRTPRRTSRGRRRSQRCSRPPTRTS